MKYLDVLILLLILLVSIVQKVVIKVRMLMFQRLMNILLFIVNPSCTKHGLREQ